MFARRELTIWEQPLAKLFFCNLLHETKLMHGCVKLKPCQRLLGPSSSCLCSLHSQSQELMELLNENNPRNRHGTSSSRRCYSPGIYSCPTGQNHLSDELRNLLTLTFRYHRNEQEKRRAYDQRLREIEHRSLSSLLQVEWDLQLEFFLQEAGLHDCNQT